MSDIVKYYFERFKIVVIVFYSFFLLAYVISLFEGDTKSILTMIYSICFFTVVGFFWYYLWQCTKLVGKRPLHYIFLTIIISIFGPVVTYSLLRKAAENQGLLVLQIRKINPKAVAKIDTLAAETIPTTDKSTGSTNKRPEGIRRIIIVASASFSICWVSVIFIMSKGFSEIQPGGWLLFFGGLIAVLLIPPLIAKVAYWVIDGFKQDKKGSA